jgi:hypothetical protein
MKYVSTSIFGFADLSPTHLPLTTPTLHGIINRYAIRIQITLIVLTRFLSLLNVPFMSL